MSKEVKIQKYGTFSYNDIEQTGYYRVYDNSLKKIAIEKGSIKAPREEVYKQYSLSQFEYYSENRHLLPTGITVYSNSKCFLLRLYIPSVNGKKPRTFSLGYFSTVQEAIAYKRKFISANIY